MPVSKVSLSAFREKNLKKEIRMLNTVFGKLKRVAIGLIAVLLGFFIFAPKVTFSMLTAMSGLFGGGIVAFLVIGLALVFLFELAQFSPKGTSSVATADTTDVPEKGGYTGASSTSSGAEAGAADSTAE